MITLSWSRKISHGYKKIELDFRELHKLTGATDLFYSVGEYRDNHRSQQDWIGGNNCLVLDVDEGMLIKHMIRILNFEGIKALIVTTRNHGKEKGEGEGKSPACDRFRVLIPTTDTFVGDIDKYKRCLAKFNASFFNCSDPVITDPARCYFSNPNQQVIYLDNERMLSYKEFYTRKPRPRKIQKVEYSGDAGIKAMINKYISEIRPNVNRNRNLRTIFYILVNKEGMSPVEARNILLDAHAKLPLEWQLDDRELNLITREAN